ncbi:MAG: radical SAM protein [Caldiserica bacterium]|nr:radical SAM protein [Caldisericota bacterium]
MKKPPFIQVDFQITERCNARCIFCHCWRNPHPEKENLPAETWIETAKRIKELAPIDFLCIGGGEPLLYGDIFRVIEGLRRLDIHTVVVTNGSLFTRENCRRILEAGVNHIDFSLDDFPEKHNQMRGMPTLFEKATAAISLLKQLNPEISLGVSTLICGENIAHLPEFTEWVLKELPVDGINFQAYNQLSIYQGKDWWRDDPLWPKEEETIIRVMDYLSRRAREGAKIANHPLQFEKFKNYFLNPLGNLNIRCPAGTFNFSVSSRGDIIGCIAEGKVGNIKDDDPVRVYRERFPAVRKKAAFCRENCHFLINCYFPLHWKRWNEVVRDMVKEEEKVDYKPGKVILPPEIREMTSAGIQEYPDLIKYEEYKHLDVIGKYEDPEERKLPSSLSLEIPCIYLCGDTSEVHRWGVELDENDFFKQVDKLKKLSSQKATYHTVVGVRRTNFHRLHKIYGLIEKARGSKKSSFPEFAIKPIGRIKERFYKYLREINAKVKQEGIEFRIVDPRLEELLTVMEECQARGDFQEKDFLLALGPVCKDVFTGPRYILFDLAGRCNLDCVYCRRFSPWNKKYWEGKHPELFGFLDFATVENVLSEAKEMDLEAVLLVGGGEPTLHPDFLRIINLIKDMGLKFNFSTNGVLLDLYNKYLIEGACTSVTVSLSFASEESFRIIRPRVKPSLLRRIEKNVQELRELKRAHKLSLPQIVALYAICKYNYREIINMALHAKMLGADSVWYQLVHLEDFSRDKLYLTREEMNEVKHLLKKAKVLCESIGLGFHSFIEFELEHYNEEKGDWSREGLLHQGCFVGWHFAFIHLRREVFMCCGAKTVGILDKKGRGLKDLWFSDIYRRYRNDGLIMHRENPLTIYGNPLYEAYCDSCDNHDQNMMMIELLKRYNLFDFVER